MEEKKTKIEGNCMREKGRTELNKKPKKNKLKQRKGRKRKKKEIKTNQKKWMTEK